MSGSSSVRLTASLQKMLDTKADPTLNFSAVNPMELPFQHQEEEEEI